MQISDIYWLLWESSAEQWIGWTSSNHDMSSRADEESLMSSMLMTQSNYHATLSTQSSLHCDSYIKALVVSQAQMMSGHHRVNIKMFQCPDCGKEFTRKFNMESHRIVSHGDSEADSDESFDRGIKATDGIDSSNEQKSMDDEGDNNDDDNSDDNDSCREYIYIYICILRSDQICCEKRKFLIQEATGTQSDDKLDYDIEDEE